MYCRAFRSSFSLFPLCASSTLCSWFYDKECLWTVPNVPMERGDSRIAPRLMATASGSSYAPLMWNFWWQQATHLSPMVLIHKWAKPQDTQHMLLPESFCCSITRQEKKILACRLDGIISGLYQEIRPDLFLDEAWLITEGKLLICSA